MPIQIIKANPDFSKDAGFPMLEISEFFYDTIQGEGIYIGQPAAFLRMQHCTQNCVFCDTQEVWRFGNPYSFDEIFALMEKSTIIEQLKNGQHLVLTGGSPLRQQLALFAFINSFFERYDFKPFIEIENECTLMPFNKLIPLIDCWNNSPKLKNSGNPDFMRYQPRVLKTLALLQNSWFKFVVSNEDDWAEIENDFLNTDLIDKSQIILMPLGADQTELSNNREKVIELAIKYGVRYSTREHIIIWNKKTGI